MIFDLIDLIGNLFLIFDPFYTKRAAKKNLEWLKQQDWYFHFTSDPKWANMLNYDKGMRKILGSCSHKKLIKDREIQDSLKKELVSHYEMYKIAWKLK